MNNKLLTTLQLHQYKIIFNRYIIYKNKVCVYDIQLDKKLKPYCKYNYWIIDDSGKGKQYTFRQLYKIAYNKIFIIDNIKDLDSEEWREIPQTNSMYFISNYGRIKSYKYYNAILLKPVDNGKGYYRIDINGRKQLLHKLVIELFNYNLATKDYDIHHKDHNKKNNSLSNLEYIRKDIHRYIENEYRRTQRKGQ